MANKMSMPEAFLCVPRFSSERKFPTMLHTYPFIHPRGHIILAVNTVVK
jgi:hypothetical protein